MNNNDDIFSNEENNSLDEVKNKSINKENLDSMSDGEYLGLNENYESNIYLSKYKHISLFTSLLEDNSFLNYKALILDLQKK